MNKSGTTMDIKLRSLIVAFALTFLPVLASAAPAVTNNPDLYTLPFDSNPQAAMRAARERVAAGDLAGAIKGLATYVNAHPKDADPARLLGDLYYRAGNSTSADLVYHRILEFYPNDRETHNRLGAVYATLNRIDDAISEYNKSLPGTDAVPDLVSLHARKGDLPAYVAQVQSEGSLGASDPDAQHSLGSLYLSLHDYGNALKYFLRELDIVPDSLAGLNQAAVAYMDVGDYTKAFTLLNRCLLKDPASYACTVNLAAGNLETRSYDRGRELLDRAKSLEPEHPEILVNYGYLQDALGDWRSAVADYVKALAISPYSRDAYLNLGIDYTQHRLFDLAESALLKGLTVAPQDAALHYWLGRTYQDQRKRDLAMKQFEAAAQTSDPQVVNLAKLRMGQLSH
ncbi:MAG: tetratricopeptide repeat protein [Candidatus Eremiobacteraeota bacterium]|nr:tetratricopeptide repeat protein [Candidatus Eremiobacteraeota bacterium]